MAAAVLRCRDRVRAAACWGDQTLTAIETRGLTKDYAIGFWRKRPYRALDNLSLEVGAGDVFGFLGPNGAGKTTTLKLLTQLVFPTSGTATLLGRPVGDVDARRRIGYLPENPYFYDYLTAQELLAYFARLFGYRGEEQRRRVERLLDEVGIGAERKLQLRKFSKGMLQRVGIAQALINEPELVIFDEPMSGLDPLGRRDVRSLILRLRDRGCTVFFSSHVLADAEALCNHVAILAAGRLVASGQLRDMMAFQRRGWEIIAGGVRPEVLERARNHVRKAVAISGGEYVFDLPPEVAPEPFIAELAGGGAVLVSANPVRHTLEDLFVEHVKGVAREPV